MKQGPASMNGGCRRDTLHKKAGVSMAMPFAVLKQVPWMKESRSY
jgi:hypothetical protein